MATRTRSLLIYVLLLFDACGNGTDNEQFKYQINLYPIFVMFVANDVATI